MSKQPWRIGCGLIWAATLLALSGSAQETEPKKPIAVRLDHHGDPLPDSALFRFGTVRFRAGNFFQGLAMSSDGKFLALNNNQGKVNLIDAATGKEIRKIAGDPGGSQTLAFTPDGKRLVSWGFQGVKITDVATGNSLGQLPIRNQTGQFGPLAFSADGKILAVGSSNFGQNQKSHLLALDINTAKELGKFEVVQNYQVKGTISGDGKILASWGQSIPRGPADHKQIQEDNRTLQIWDLASGKELRRVLVSGYGIASVALSADGKNMAIASGAGSTLTLWDTKTGKEIRRWACRRANQSVLTFSADGKILALADATDGTLQIWDTVSHKRLGLFEGKNCRFAALAFLDKGTIRMCGMEGQAIVVWEVLPEKILSPVGGHRHQISSLAFAPSGKELMTASFDGTICYWDLATGKEIRRRRFQDEDARRMGLNHYFQQGGLALSADAKYLAAHSQFNRYLRLWDQVSGKVLCDFEGNNDVLGLAFSANGQLLAAGGRDRMVRVWNIASGQELSQFQGQASQGLGLAFSPDGKSLAVQGFGFLPGRQVAEVLVAEVAGGKILWKVENQNIRNAPLAFTNDGKILLTVDPAKVSLRDPSTGKELRHFQTNENNVVSMAISPDNRLLALAQVAHVFRGNVQEAVSAISVWEMASGQMRCRFQGHLGPITCLAFSKDGKNLASGSSDTTALLWNVRAGQKEPRAGAWTPKDNQEVWEMLADSSGKAHVAIDKMLSAPAEAMSLLKANLTIPKAVAVDPKQIQQWIEDLGSDQFAARESASKKLEQVGRLAADALAKARSGNQALEVSRRLDNLLKKLEAATPSPKDLRRLRALEVLEMLASPDARAMLQQHAKGIPGDPITLDAQGALRRLPTNGK